MQINNIKRVFFIFMLASAFHLLEAYSVQAAEGPDFELLIGEWVRTDGGYIIRLKEIKPDGSPDISYFNPKEINIAEAQVSEWKGMKKLFLKLQDQGYPGSTYTLYYYAEKDALAGFYYQANLKQTFEVVFLRK